MKRYDYWEGMLDGFFESRREAKFEWGRNDCVLFACDAVLVMTGEDLARGFRDSYNTARGAFKAMASLGAADVGELADIFAARLGLRILPPSFAQRGDVMLLDRELGESLGIVALNGVDVLAPGEERISDVPLSAGLRAWRI